MLICCKIFNFFLSADRYLNSQTGFLGLWGKKVDSIEYYQQQVKELDEKVSKLLTTNY